MCRSVFVNAGLKQPQAGRLAHTPKSESDDTGHETSPHLSCPIFVDPIALCFHLDVSISHAGYDDNGPRRTRGI